MVKFADVKKAHTAKGWMGMGMVPPDGRSPFGYGGGMRHGNVGGYWQATAPPAAGGRDMYGKGREMYPDYGRGYPYQVWWNGIIWGLSVMFCFCCVLFLFSVVAPPVSCRCCFCFVSFFSFLSLSPFSGA